MFKKLIRLFGIFALLLVIVVAAGLRQAWFFWVDGVPADGPTEIVVEEGTGFSALADQLEEDDLVRSAFWFKVLAYLHGAASDLKAGSYVIETGASYANLINLLVDGTVGDDLSVTIPEGYTEDQIAELVVERFAITRAEWDAVGNGMEGYLFPDTYRFFVDATAQDIVAEMRALFDQKVEGLAPPDGYVEKDLVTIASIIEREVQVDADMALVADIIYKRLDAGMPLQMDSTVNYFTGKDTPSISFADRDIDHPYNTYLYAGLPPGPISNPGLNALKAAANPEANDYYYFLTDADGAVHYAETYEQHLANKAQYLD